MSNDTIINCSECLSYDVCMYKNLSIALRTEHPYLKIICTKFISRDSQQGHIKDKISTIQNWRKDNPNGKKIDCQRETGISRPTIIKYWDYKEE